VHFLLLQKKLFLFLIWVRAEKRRKRIILANVIVFIFGPHASTFFHLLLFIMIYFAITQMLSTFASCSNCCCCVMCIREKTHSHGAHTTLWVTQVESAMVEWRLSSENECKLHTLNLLLWYEDSFMYTLSYDSVYCLSCERKERKTFKFFLLRFFLKKIRFLFKKRNLFENFSAKITKNYSHFKPH
jgi:hypothetical protein